MNNDTKPETTGTAPATPEVSKVDPKDTKFAAVPKAMNEDDKKSLDDAKQASSTAPPSTR